MSEASTYIFYAGDSTAAQKRFNAYPETGMGQMLPLFLKPGMQVLNHAVNGRSTKSFIDEGRLDVIDSEIRPGDLLFIEFGHNDEKINDPTRYTEAFGSFSDNLKVFIDTARKHGATPLLMTAIERRGFDENGELKHSHGDYIEAVKRVAEQEKCAFTDMNALTRELIIKTGEEESKKFFMNFGPGIYENYPEGKSDNTHLRPEGAIAFARLIALEMKKLGSPFEEAVLEELK